jgi:hypothetical protein
MYATVTFLFHELRNFYTNRNAYFRIFTSFFFKKKRTIASRNIHTIKYSPKESILSSEAFLQLMNI